MRVNNPEARAYYEKEATEQMWSTRRLERNISTLYYERLLSSQKKGPVIQEMLDKTSDPGKNKEEFTKNLYVLEFLHLPGNLSHSEGVIEESLLHHLQDILLENLGNRLLPTLCLPSMLSVISVSAWAFRNISSPSPFLTI